MVPGTARRTAGHEVQLLAAGRTPRCATSCRRSPTTSSPPSSPRVPSYEDALSGSMGRTSRNAVQLALGGFLALASGRRRIDPRTPTAPGGRGAPTSSAGRGPAAGAPPRRCWRTGSVLGSRGATCPPPRSVRGGRRRHPGGVRRELVFAYIDELSAASVASHADETATTGRVRQRLLERVAHHLLGGSPADAVLAAAGGPGGSRPHADGGDRAPVAQVRPVLASVAPATSRRPTRPRLDEGVLLLVPDAHGHRRRRCCARWPTAAAPPDRIGRGWRCASYERALRAQAPTSASTQGGEPGRAGAAGRRLGRADLRARVLAPLDGMRPATVEAHRHAALLAAPPGSSRRRRRRALRAPQTVRYRMGQLRERYGDRLETPTPCSPSPSRWAERARWSNG